MVEWVRRHLIGDQRANPGGTGAGDTSQFETVQHGGTSAGEKTCHHEPDGETGVAMTDLLIRFRATGTSPLSPQEAAHLCPKHRAA